ncbi:tetratricopeptide repeat protein [Desulfovibrio sp. OttesenSCG-928-F20]|nr:tetratricopeptide repeat protein [Desulfovibrio sp. OttesenSCG-928-F20]
MSISREQAALLGKVAFMGLWQGRFAESDAIFTALHESTPDRIGPVLGLAMSQAHQGHYAKAIDILQNKALPMHPDDPHAKAWLGLALFKAGQVEKAGAILNELIAKESPDDVHNLAQSILQEMAA